MTAVESPAPRALVRGAAGAGPAAERRGFGWLRERVGVYVALTKPRIIELLLVTTLPTMILAERGLPPLWLVAATLAGGSLAAGSANTLNCYLDRDIDGVMHRTGRRPLATGAVTPRAALVFGSVLAVLSVAWFAVLVGVLSAALTAAAIAFYVGVYTLGLKRRTPQNIVWGGAAGCMPVLIGWSAVTGSLSWSPLVLFLVIFFWTPPHYWPLALRFKADYAAAGVPMLPVVAGVEKVATQVVRYSWAMVAVSLALWPVADLGVAYGVPALLLGALFLAEAHRLSRAAHAAARGEAATVRPMRLFHGSITYLTLLFLVVAVSALLA